jgi:hypothetical protein
MSTRHGAARGRRGDAARAGLRRSVGQNSTLRTAKNPKQESCAGVEDLIAAAKWLRERITWLESARGEGSVDEHDWLSLYLERKPFDYLIDGLKQTVMLVEHIAAVEDKQRIWRRPRR